jgi:hypothetical protein
MRTNLNEEIQKNLRLMGILNEAASPSKGIFKLLVGSLLGNSLDTAIAKIEAKTGKTFAGKGIKAFEDAIASGGITRKQATKIIVDAMIAGGKSIDEIATEVTSKTPNFLEAVRRASKSGVDKAEVKAAVPELAELSDDLVDAILKKGGYDAIGKTLDDTNKLVADFVGSYPELFEKLPWFKKGGYKNAAKIKEIQNEINRRFAGKNRAAIQNELKKIFDEANEAIKKSKLAEPEKQAWYAALAKSAKETATDILKAPISRDQVTGAVNIGWTGMRYAGAIIMAGFVGKLGYNVLSTGSVAGGVAATGRSEFDAAKQELTKKGDFEATPESFAEFITKEYPVYDIKNFKLSKVSETEWSATYKNPNDGKDYGPFKFVYDNGIYKEQ